MKSYYLPELRYALRTSWKKWSHPLIQTLTAASLAFATVAIWNTSEGRTLDHWVLRHFFLLRGPRPPPEDVVLIAIDDESYLHLGASTNFPLPRHYLADALEAIEMASPKAIILDAKIPAQPNMEPEADDRIEAALRAGPTSIWTGELPPEDSEASDGEQPVPMILSSDARFRHAAKMQLPMTVAAEDNIVLYVSYGTSPDATLFERAPIAKALVELAKLNISEPGPDDLINFYGPKGTFHRIPLYRLLDLENVATREELREKIVLIGYQSLSSGRGTANKDEFEVPVSKFPMFGVEMHANIIGNLIDRSWLKQPARRTGMKLLLVLTLSIACVGMRLSANKVLPAVIGLTTLLLLVDYYAFAVKRIWISGIGSLLVASAVTIVVIAVYRIWSTEQFRKFINKAFGLKDQGI